MVPPPFGGTLTSCAHFEAPSVASRDNENAPTSWLVRQFVGAVVAANALLRTCVVAVYCAVMVTVAVFDWLIVVAVMVAVPSTRPVTLPSLPTAVDTLALADESALHTA